MRQTCFACPNWITYEHLLDNFNAASTKYIRSACQDFCTVCCVVALLKLISRTKCSDANLTKDRQFYAVRIYCFSVDTKNQLDVTFCILYFSSNSCSTCFGQPCAHHQELTTAWFYSLVLVCAVAAGRYQVRLAGSASYGRTTCQLLMMGTWLPETCWATIRREIKNTKSDI